MTDADQEGRVVLNSKPLAFWCPDTEISSCFTITCTGTMPTVHKSIQISKGNYSKSAKFSTSFPAVLLTVFFLLSIDLI